MSDSLFYSVTFSGSGSLILWFYVMFTIDSTPDISHLFALGTGISLLTIGICFLFRFANEKRLELKKQK